MVAWPGSGDGERGAEEGMGVGAALWAARGLLARNTHPQHGCGKIAG